MHITPLALGDANARLRVYIANRPDFVFAHHGREICSVIDGEIAAVGNACGNGWRKVFNVYAKLLFALPDTFTFKTGFSTWQAMRDASLLQLNSNTLLSFSPPTCEEPGLHIVMGKTYAKGLAIADSLFWLNDDFAINQQKRVIVCPYFDYRQLSNIKIDTLVGLINEYWPDASTLLSR